MKKVFISVFFLVSFTVSAFQNEPDGFRGVKWGASITKIGKEFSFHKKISDSEIVYIKNTDSLKIGDAKLTNVTYSFLDQRFVMAMVTAKKLEKDNLVASLTYNFGNPYYTDKNNTWVWNGKTTSILLTCEKISLYCYLEFYSGKILNKMMSEHSTKLQNQAIDSMNDF